MKKLLLFSVVILTSSLYSHPFRSILSTLRYAPLQKRSPHSHTPYSQNELTQLAKIREDYYKKLGALAEQEQALALKRINLEKEYAQAKSTLISTCLLKKSEHSSLTTKSSSYNASRQPE